MKKGCLERHPFLLFQHRDGVRNGLFHRFSAVLIHLGFVFLAVGEATRAADTAAGACHALDEVGI